MPPLAQGPYLVLIAFDKKKRGVNWMVAVGRFAHDGTRHIALAHGWNECQRAMPLDASYRKGPLIRTVP
jgi:hypothetical protein